MTVERTATTGMTRRAGSSDVVGWRRRRLLEAGFPSGLAERLAATAGVDLHALLDLVNRGCPPELADRILAPLTDLEPPA
ncbi:MAG: hypothetical protein ABI468_00620 [Candidatus Nanopelagicales bacterium]